MALGAEEVRETEGSQETWRRIEHLELPSARTEEKSSLEGIFTE